MKIKILTQMGPLQIGDILDGSYSAINNQAHVFDLAGAGWYLYPGQFEAVPDVSISDSKENLRSLIGQDVAKLEIIFK